MSDYFDGTYSIAQNIADHNEVAHELDGCEKEVTRLEAENSQLRMELADLKSAADEIAAEPEFETSDRGFKFLPPITSTHGGTIEVYESSAAEYPAVWVRIQENMRGAEPSDSHAHLPIEDALALSQQLAWLARNHYQVRQEPTDA